MRHVNLTKRRPRPTGFGKNASASPQPGADSPELHFGASPGLRDDFGWGIALIPTWGPTIQGTEGSGWWTWPGPLGSNARFA
jgi:hypothetical protein